MDDHTQRREAIRKLLEGHSAIPTNEYEIPEKPDRYLGIEYNFTEDAVWAMDGPTLAHVAQQMDNSDTKREGASVHDLDTGEVFQVVECVARLIGDQGTTVVMAKLAATTEDVLRQAQELLRSSMFALETEATRELQISLDIFLAAYGVDGETDLTKGPYAPTFSVFDNCTGKRVSEDSYATAAEANRDYFMNEGHTHVARIEPLRGQ